MVCQLRFHFPRSATCALMSSCFFACSMLDDTGGQDGLRRGERPSSAARSMGICRSAATDCAGSSTPRTHQGHLLTAKEAGSRNLLVFYFLRCQS